MIAELTIVKKFTTFEIENDFLYILLHRNTPTGNPSSGTNCGNRIGGRVRSYAVIEAGAATGTRSGKVPGTLFRYCDKIHSESESCQDHIASSSKAGFTTCTTG